MKDLFSSNNYRHERNRIDGIILYKVIKSSTGEISFYIDESKAAIHEQDFVLITDSEKKPEKQYLAQVARLIQTRGEEIKGTF